MKFAVALACIFLSISTLVSAARVTPRSSCEGGQVTGNTTISHNGGNIGVVSGTCPTSGGAKRSTLEERQYSLCAGTPTQGTCYTVTCENLGTSTILTADCQNLYNYLASYPGYAAIAAGTYQKWTWGTCAFYFSNLDVYEYDAYNAGMAVTQCIGYTNGAVCDGSMAAGDAYEIAVKSP